MGSNPNPGMIAWLEELRAAEMKTADLSNMNIDMVRHVRGTSTG